MPGNMLDALANRAESLAERAAGVIDIWRERAQRREAVEDGLLRDQRARDGGRAAEDGWPREM